MSGVEQVERIAVLAPIWSVPATLADFECEHGELSGCTRCDADDQQAELDRELELEAVR